MYSDDSLCAYISAELLGSTNRCSSDDSLPYNTSEGMKVLIQVEALISPSCAEGADLSLPETTLTELDCDGAPLQCSPAHAQPTAIALQHELPCCCLHPSQSLGMKTQKAVKALIQHQRAFIP